jgi:hypothetical protein
MKKPNKAVHPTLTRVTPRAWSLALPARVAPRASVGDLGRSPNPMKTRNLLYSFLAAWVTSICLLMLVGIFTEPRTISWSISKVMPALVLFSAWSFVVLAPVWIIFVVPFFHFARRHQFLPHRVVTSFAASLAAFALMYVLMNSLPVERKQWPVFCSIAAVVGFLGSMILFTGHPPQAARPTNSPACHD